MKKRLCFCFLIYAACIASGTNRGFQLWNQNGIEVFLNDKLSIGANEKIQYRTESGIVGLKYGDVFLNRKILPWLDLGLSGRILLMNEPGGWLQENRPMIYCNLKKKMGVFSVSIANRMGYRMFDLLEDHFRHRHMVTLEVYPFHHSNTFSFYMGEEAFYLLNKEQFHLFRLHSGTKIKCNNLLEMKLYYVFERLRKTDGWNPSDVLGFDMKIKF